MSIIHRHILRTIISSRTFHITSRLNIDPKTVEEIRIPVPWGHIAGKRWGEKTGQPIIALHGLLDNSSTFDNLLPLLDVPSVLCLDLSGQGMSSHTPRGTSLYYSDYITHLRFVLKYQLKWDTNLIFLGHSFGSSVLFNYAAIYPHEVSKMINIDCARHRNAVNTKKFIQQTRYSVEGFLNSEKESSIIADGFSLDDSVKRMHDTRESIKVPLSLENCKLLALRGSANMGNGKYYFTHDKKLKFNSFGRNTFLFNLALASKIKSAVLNIHATRGINDGIYGLEEEKQLKIMAENCNSCRNLVLDADHHLHLTSAKLVAPHINKFLND